MGRKIVFALGIAVAAAVVRLYRSTLRQLNAAHDAVTRFHELYSDENFHEIRASATEEFRDTVPESELSALRRKFGARKFSTAGGWWITKGLRSSEITLCFDGEFEAGRAYEQFVWRVYRGDVRLARYRIDEILPPKRQFPTVAGPRQSG